MTNTLGQFLPPEVSDPPVPAENWVLSRKKFDYKNACEFEERPLLNAFQFSNYQKSLSRHVSINFNQSLTSIHFYIFTPGTSLKVSLNRTGFSGNS